MPTLTRAELAQILEALDRARGQLAVALRASDPAPAVRDEAWRRAAGELRKVTILAARATGEEERDPDALTAVLY